MLAVLSWSFVCSSAVMADLVPDGVIARESDDATTWRASSLPEEQAAVARASERRQLQHGTVRELARGALAELGVAPQPIFSGAQRQPLWPDGIVGSLTHCPGYCAAAVASADLVATVGIDAEGDAPLTPGLVRRLTAPAELEALRWFDPDEGVRGKVLFSIKESIYKAWYPGTGRWLGFGDVEVVCQPDERSGAVPSGRFAAHVLVDHPPWLSVIGGRFERTGGFVRAASVVTADRLTPDRGATQEGPRTNRG
jgi:4'-phosphopantetheinyl transferase EntD